MEALFYICLLLAALITLVLAAVLREAAPI